MDPQTIIAGMNAIKGITQAVQPVPAGPSVSNPFFGASLFNADSSGWLVNFGASQGQTNGDKVAPAMGGNAPGGAALPGVAVSAAIPMEFILIGGAVLLVLFLKKRG